MSFTTHSGAASAAAPVGPPDTADPPPRRRRAKYDLTGSLFMLPYVVLLLLFGLGPTIYSIAISLVGVKGQTPFGSSYVKMLADFRFWPAVANVGIYLAIWLPIMVGGVMLLALLLHQRRGRFSGLMRLAYFLPGAVTGSAAVMLWYCMLEPSFSPFGPALRAMGFESGTSVFQNQNLTIIFALIAFTTGVGQWIIIMYGAMQNIPDEILEAAQIDGSGPIRTALQVKLPLVSKYVVYMVVLSLANGVQLFVEPQLIYAITRSAGSPWWSLNQFGYSLAFQNSDFGSAAAVSIVLLVVCVAAGLFMVFRTDFFATEVDE